MQLSPCATLQQRTEMAIARLREFCPPEGYYVAFSGGKDSVVVLDLVRRAGVAYDAHYNLTTVDPPELVRFIRQHHEVTFNRPSMTMWQLIEKKLWAPMRQQRWCCQELKEGAGQGRRVITGVRWEESARRGNRRMLEVCNRKRATTYLHPIIDWTTADVWEYIRTNEVPYCSLYDDGFKRLGCILCPMREDVSIELARWPKYADAYRRAFDRVVQIRKERRMECSWNNGDEMMAWWLDRKRKSHRRTSVKVEPDQHMMLED